MLQNFIKLSLQEQEKAFAKSKGFGEIVKGNGMVSRHGCR